MEQGVRDITRHQLSPGQRLATNAVAHLLGQGFF